MIQIDCSLLLVNLSQEYRFNWAQVKLKSIVSYSLKLDEINRFLLLFSEICILTRLFEFTITKTSTIF